MKRENRKFFINGTHRILQVDPESDSLATVLRRAGYKSVKNKCGVGQCGACTVLINGEALMACSLRLDQVPRDASIETFEGIGGAVGSNHPLQLAWDKYADVQCGFCKPGFITSAKALLDVNSDPTRKDVRQWFVSHKNICRCSGYKPMVDAVMAAAKVMRGECDAGALKTLPQERERERGFSVLRGK